MTDPKPRPASRKRTRKTRTRPRPKMLDDEKLNEIGKRRCLMLLEVLSGRQSVTDAIAKAKISRGTYYQLETRALSAMLEAMTPGSPSSTTSSSDEPRVEIDKLTARVEKLTADKRRLERLLQMAKKVVAPGKMTTGRGRKRRRGSASAGRNASPSSAKKTAVTTKATKRSPTSTPTEDGEGE